MTCELLAELNAIETGGIVTPGKKRNRLDECLVTQGLATDIQKARSLIMAGQAVVADQMVDKPGFLVPNGAAVRLKGAVRAFASRGGDKLAGAVLGLGLTGVLKDAVVLDIGAATGGFTDVCLSHGAARVYAVDRGTNLLDYRLIRDPRVVVMDGTDAREFRPNQFKDVGIVVADISFAALAELLPAIVAAVAAPAAKFLVLVKPQFELPVTDVPAGGVVVGDADRQRAVAEVVAAFTALGLSVEATRDSSVTGRKGNREIFCLASRPKQAP